jgi:ABC-type dipeptide/oligopeptide/nickel transport system permease subunit
MPESKTPVAEIPDAPAGGAQPGPGLVEREFTVAERTQWEQALRRFLRHRVAVASLVVFVLLFLFAFVLPHFWQFKYDGLPTNDINSKPSIRHPFGTNNLGTDQFAVIMRGTQQSLKIALSIAALATIGGATWGVVSGYFGGIVDSALMRLADLILTLPPLALAAALGHNFGGTWWIIAIVLGSLSMPYVARVVRGVVLSLREREFVEAARALGASNSRIMFRHLIPNSVAVLIVNATLLVAGGILGETALSFFGFGVRPPDTSLGLLTFAGQGAIDTRPWLFYFPGLFIVLIALSVNFIGDGLRDALDPRQTRERR